MVFMLTKRIIYLFLRIYNTQYKYMFNRNKLNYFQKLWMGLDKKIFFTFVLYIILGCLFIFTTSIPVAERINVDTYFFVKKQIIYIFLSLGIGSLILILGDFLNIKIITICFVSLLFMLLLVNVIGFSTKGAKRWLYIAGFSIQPSEIIKPFWVLITSYILYISKDLPDFFKIIFSFIPLAIVSIFLYLQPDIGILILLFCVYISMIFLSNIKFKNILIIGFTFLCILLLSYLTLSHVKNRINTYFLSLKNSKNMSYQVSTSLKAYKNSGYFGNGLLNGKVKKIIPDTHTDFIFPSIVEEFGFLFALLLLCLLMYVVMRIFIIAYQNKCNTFKFLSINGLNILIIYQTFINIGVTLNLLPTKGMTLPFFSYGGSSLIGVIITFSLILNYTKKVYENNLETKDIFEIPILNL